jgi:hypothetical protein
MKSKKPRKSNPRAVKDLAPKTAKTVKGGLACATGEHIKKAVLTVR